jgi:hypothetical protein
MPTLRTIQGCGSDQHARISEPRSVDLLPPTLQTIPEAFGRNIAIARARTRSRTEATIAQTDDENAFTSYLHDVYLARAIRDGE